jgi:branched-chain amino acid transport system substrate-binding protein
MVRCSAAACVAAVLAVATPALAQDLVKVGMIVPMTGPFASTGKQLVAGARLYRSSRATWSPARRSSSW